MQIFSLEKRVIFTIVLLVLCIPGLHSQERTIRVWESKIPGAIGNPSYREDTIYIDGRRPRITNVTDPTLDFYPAPKEKSAGAAIVICPGGGYVRLAIDHEGSDVAAWLNKMGISAFVLKYRLPSDAIMADKSIGPLQDGLETIRLVRRHAGEWNINPHKIGILGFSAGGHLASTVSTHFAEKVYEPADTTSARPDFSILVYPVISMDSMIADGGSRTSLLGKAPSQELVQRFSNELWVNKNTPPTFMVHASDDMTVPVENSIRYLLALKRNAVHCELHVYETGGHGFGLGTGEGTESTWPEACIRWLRERRIL